MCGQNIRFAYLSGPVDALDVYEKWAAGRQLDYFGTSYLSQFYQLCSDQGAEGYIITTLPGSYIRQRIGQFVIENRPEPVNFHGVFFHLTAVLWILRLLPSLAHFRPNALIITALPGYWFILSILRLWKIPIIAALHCTLWPKFGSVRTSWRLLLYLNSFFIAHCVSAFLAASKDIADQIRTLARGRDLPIKIFLPTYPESQFRSILPAHFDTQPFVIMFAGRIERNKGVYDLTTIARRLEQIEPRRFHFDICGDGAELESLRHQIEHLNLTSTVNCHGFCKMEKFTSILDKAHAVIVPTTTQFEEGFAMICAEAILAERPVITSAVCPALYYVKEAAIEVIPDDVEGYIKAIVDLSSDYALYERKRLACRPLQSQFFDTNNGWGSKMKEVFREQLSTGR